MSIKDEVNNWYYNIESSRSINTKSPKTIDFTTNHYSILGNVSKGILCEGTIAKFYETSSLAPNLLLEGKVSYNANRLVIDGIKYEYAQSGGGTTDYAVDIYYYAVRGEKFTCPIKVGTRMDMMYMPDALRAAIELMEANPDRLIHHNGFNVAAMSFDPDMIYHAIRKLRPDFEMEYDVDPLKQSIAESWPDMMDDSCARREWGWEHHYGLTEMTRDMLEKLSAKLKLSEKSSSLFA